MALDDINFIFIFRAFELALRTYEGDDPFEPWFNYIVWIEQTFPKTGKDGNLNALLEKCIQQFKGNGQYNQDIRFFEVWMKYVRFKDYLKFGKNFLSCHIYNKNFVFFL